MSSSSLSIKAAILHEPKKSLNIETITIAPPRHTEVRVKIKASAICHSDISYIDGKWECQTPIVLGHEASGIVESIGPLVRHVSVNDHVVVTLLRHCGICNYCRLGAPMKCQATIEHNTPFPLTDSKGNPITQGLKTAAFAEYVLVDESQINVIDKDIPFDSASIVACGGITGYGAVHNTAKIKAGSDIVVIGVGGVGLNIIQAAVLGGARNIIAIDIQESKKQAATKFGATHFISAKDSDAYQKICNITQKEGADYVFISVGVQKAIEDGLYYVTPLGTVILVGMPGTGVNASIDPDTIANNNLTIKGSKMGEAIIHKDVPILLDFYKRKKILLDELVTNHYELGQINEAIDLSRSGAVLRNVIMFD